MSNNILNRPFGLNIALPTRTLKQVGQTAQKAFNFFAPMDEYLKENNQVFSGDVAKEIDKYNRMAYALGSTVRDGKAEVHFEMKG